MGWPHGPPGGAWRLFYLGGRKKGDSSFRWNDQASLNDRGAGMSGRRRSGVGEDRFGGRDILRPSDLEPQPLVHRSEAASRGDRPIPENVGRERTGRQIAG